MPLFTEKQHLLDDKVLSAIKRYPRNFDERLWKGLLHLIAKKENKFFEMRPLPHLLKITLAQYFLQKRMELAIEAHEQEDKEAFARIFSASSSMCIALIFPNQRQEILHQEHLVRAVEAFIPGVKEIPDSFFTWQSNRYSYQFCYLELQKPRGKDLSKKELKKLQIDLQKQVLHGIASSCPYVFSPYNYEESYRQLMLLQKELKSPGDLPQISVYFKGQTSSDLEFLVYMVRPESKIPIEENIQRLPSFVRISLYTNQRIEPRSEAFAFSLHIPISCLDAGPIINQLEARKYIVGLLEKMIGPFRDFNGGLFTKQNEVFDKLTKTLIRKIPGFTLFAESLFYSLKPVEAQITLETEQAEILFKTFAEGLKEKKSFFIRHDPKGILIIKTKDALLIEPLIEKLKKINKIAYARIRVLEAQYLVILDPSMSYASQIEQELSEPIGETKASTLRLAFSDKSLASLNPHHVTCDVRCRVVYKALFEGLVRLDEKGNPVLAGAQKIITSQDGMTYTFILRPNNWSNGEKVTAFHYVEGWKQVFELADRIDIIPFLFIKNSEKILQGKSPLSSLGVRAIDSNVLEVHLEVPDPHFLQRLSQPLFSPAYDSKKEPQVFNGPYFVHLKNELGLLLKQNPHFWEFDQIQFDTIEIFFIPSPTVSFDLFEKGSIDWIGSPFCAIPTEAVSRLNAQNALRSNYPLRFYWLHMNAKCRPFQSRSIRQALSLALDREFIHRTILHEIPLYSPLPSSLAAASLPHDLGDPQALFEQGLEEVGFGRNTLLSLKLRYCSDPKIEQLVRYIQKTWQSAFGIDLQLEFSDWNAFRSALEKGDFQIGGYYESQYCPDPLDILQRFALPHHLSHLCQPKNPLFREKVAQARSTKNQEQKISWTKEAEELFIQEMPVIPISHSIQQYAHHPNLTGYVFDNTGCVDFRWAFSKD